jgi:hypothetical protein
MADSLESESGLDPDDPDLLAMNRLLLMKAAALESETASNVTDDTSPPQTTESK